MRHVHGIPATVYEAEPAPDARRQGGLLDLHPDSGQAALEAAGLIEEFRKLVLPGREAYRVMDQAGNVLIDLPDDGTGERPEAPRGGLRQMLLDSLPAGTVRWGHKVTRVRALGKGRHQVDFADSSTVVADLLIGADGAWSRVRPLLSEAVPEYFGVCSIETFLFDAGTRHPASAEAVGAGSLFALAPGRGLLAHREGGGTLHTYAQLRKSRDWFAGLDATDAAALTVRAAKEFDGWAPELTALITDSDTPPALRPICTLPAGHRWDRIPGATLLGDAAHLRAPNGEGANLAMQDGAELGRALAAHPGDAEAALSVHEQAMFARAAAVEADDDGFYTIMLDDNAPHSLLALMTGAEQDA
ncbi:FAD-dependent oxidoreductase [Saccharopolyspora shandongensis]|uniref:FAD-dependent oxidoreductase n=1 Tax=Saccharopolyspora shandongensis TaxID=418495 RepID=UPI0034070962